MSNYEHFTDKELRCQCGCNQSNPNHEFHTLMTLIVTIRKEFGESMPITSGYRCENHPIEAKKKFPGQHTRAAVDIQVSGDKAVRLLRVAMKYPLIKGIGVNQTGNWNSRFLHLDIRDNEFIWSY